MYGANAHLNVMSKNERLNKSYEVESIPFQKKRGKKEQRPFIKKKGDQLAHLPNGKIPQKWHNYQLSCTNAMEYHMNIILS